MDEYSPRLITLQDKTLSIMLCTNIRVIIIIEGEKMTPSVIEVKPMGGHMLLLTFSNQEKRILDMTPFLSDPFWAPIAPEPLFKTAKADGISISWCNGIDLSPEDAYSFSKQAGQ
jgi:hypothetical protein